MWWILLTIAGIIAMIAIYYKGNNNIVNSHKSYNTNMQNSTVTTANSDVQRTPDIETRIGAKMPTSYIVFDLETTGLSREKDQILEIGAIKHHNFIEIERFHSYVKPTIPISSEASNVNGIYYEDVCNSPSVSKVLEEFKLFIAGYPMLAHNVKFDSDFIHNQSTANNINLGDIKYYDTLIMARELMPQLPNHKLETIKQFLNIKVGSHNAIDDCIVTNNLYVICLELDRSDTYELQKSETSLDISNWRPESHKSEEKALSENMQNYFDEFCKILARNNINLSAIYKYEGVNCLTIRYDLIHIDKSLYFNETILFIHLGARLRYCLIDIPIDKFENCGLSVSPASKSEGTHKTRVFLTNSTDLQLIENQILNIYNLCIKRHKQYIESRKPHIRYFV